MATAHRGGRSLASARRAAGYTQESLADALHVDRTTVARWETGARSPVPYIRPRLAQLLGCTRRELQTMLASEQPPPSQAQALGGSELADVLAAGARAGAGVVGALRLHLDALRGMDRSIGAAAVRDELRVKLRQVDDMAHAATTSGERSALLRLLVELHTLAGWTANDQADGLTAWRQHNHAQVAATAAGSIAHQAHAQAQQAVVLAEAGHVERASAQAIGAVETGRGASRALRAWLEASNGEVLAHAGEREAALRAFDRADRLVGDELAEPEPYVGLDVAHLARWRGQVLVQLAHPDALATVTRALAAHDPAYRRSEAALRIDLAQGLARADRDAARAELARGVDMARATGSPRLLRRGEAVGRGLFGTTL